MTTGSAGFAPSRRGRAAARRRQVGEVEAVIDELQPFRSRGQLLEPLQAQGRAGHQPGTIGELFRHFPGFAGPDVLGVRRHAPRQAAHRGGVARHRGWRVQEMGVEPLDRGRQLGRQHQRLPPAPQSIGRGIAPEVGEEFAPRRLVARQMPRLPPGREHATGIVLEILRQVDRAGSHAVVHGMMRLVGRPAQRPDFQRHAARLQPGDLLGDEGLGQPRPAFQDEGDARVPLLSDGRRHEMPGDQVLARAGGDTAGSTAGASAKRSIDSSAAGPR